MKKTLLTLCLSLMALAASAQVDSAALIQAQQQQLLLQQQQENIADQQKAMVQQEKELAKQDALVAKQLKKAQKAERRERIGRNGRLSIAPGIAMGVWSFDQTALYSGANGALSANVTWHQPIAPKWNLDFGLGYQWNVTRMQNTATFNDSTQLLSPHRPDTWGREENYFTFSTIELPLILGRVFQDGSELYFGLRLGCRFGAAYSRHYFSLNEQGGLERQQSDATVGFGQGKQMNRFSCKVVLGTEEKSFLFAPGCELYFDLVPTMCQFPADEKVFMHEFGVRVSL